VNSLLGEVSLTRQSLENDPAIVYFLDRGLQITHCNFAWDRFANDNGGKDLSRRMVLGRFVMDVIPPPLRTFYADAYHSVLESRRPWECTYECSSANVFRSFRMAIYHDPQDTGLVVVNSLTVEGPHGSEREPCQALTDIYENPDSGIIAMCSHCRRTRRAHPKAPEIWDWVPGYIDNPPRSVSHGICGVCMSVVYRAYFDEVESRWVFPPPTNSPASI
jgi:hypothetical protein